MRRLVKEGRAHPRVQQRARQIVSASPGLHPVEACYRYVQALPYRRDEQLAAQAGLDPDTSEILQGAPYQIEIADRYGPSSVVGDCDCRSILLQSLLESLGYRTSFVLVKGPGRQDYSHVYTEVAIEGGRKVPLDTIFDGLGGREKFKPGDEVKGARERKTVPVDGKSWLGAAALFGLLWLAFGGRR